MDLRGRHHADSLGRTRASAPFNPWHELGVRVGGANPASSSAHARTLTSLDGRTTVYTSNRASESNSDSVATSGEGVQDDQSIGAAHASAHTILLALVRLRKLRAALFSEKLFAQPAWDMLLELLECHLRARRISVSSLYLAAGVPPATALRRINDMEAAGLIRRAYDPRDRRRQFVELTPRTRDKLANFFQDAQVRAALLIDEPKFSR